MDYGLDSTHNQHQLFGIFFTDMRVNYNYLDLFFYTIIHSRHLSMWDSYHIHFPR